MADIELVIKIPEEDFERCKKRFQMRIGIMGDAIANGTPLPKRHGRLIDADELLKHRYTVGTSNYCEYNVVDEEEINHAPTIIEADKEQEDGNVD